VSGGAYGAFCSLCGGTVGLSCRCCPEDRLTCDGIRAVKSLAVSMLTDSERAVWGCVYADELQLRLGTLLRPSEANESTRECLRVLAASEADSAIRHMRKRG
jgi:hypothetical protein